MRANRSTTIRAGLLAAAVTVALSGCAAEQSRAKGGDSGREEIRRAAIQYASCMRERGYEVPDPTFDEQGLPHFAGPTEISKGKDFQSDGQQCRAGLNSALQAAGVPAKEKATPEQLVAFTRCVREQGLQIADPQPGENLAIPKETLNSPAWPATVEACRQHLPPEEAAGIGKVGKR